MSHNKDRQQGFKGVRNAEIVRSIPAFVKPLGIGLAVVAVMLLGYFFWQKNAYQTTLETQSATTTVSDLQGDVQALVDARNSAAANKYTSGVVPTGDTMTVKLAVLADPDLFDFNNTIKRNCDSVVLVPTVVPASPLMLQSAIHALLNDTFDYGFVPANSIARYDSLELESARIVDGVATINLKGSLPQFKNACETTRAMTQLTETARQFGNVTDVRVYLNGVAL